MKEFFRFSKTLQGCFERRFLIFSLLSCEVHRYVNKSCHDLNLDAMGAKKKMMGGLAVFLASFFLSR
jgi:hypothetical protein